MGGVLRQGGRALAIYFSDVVLWLSLAGLLEVAFFIFAGLLCIFTAGFIFEGMKRSPRRAGAGQHRGAVRHLPDVPRGARADLVARRGGSPSSTATARRRRPPRPPHRCRRRRRRLRARRRSGSPSCGRPAGTGFRGRGSAREPDFTSGAACKAMLSCAWSEVFERCDEPVRTPSGRGYLLGAMPAVAVPRATGRLSPSAARRCASAGSSGSMPSSPSRAP